MLAQAPAFREYLKNRQEAIDSEKSQRESVNSNLFNEKTFYREFVSDMLRAEKEIIIYSPFVTKFRTDFFKQTIEKLRKRNVEIFIFTRPIEEYEPFIQPQIECALKRYEESGVCVTFLDGSIHEKIAIIDRKILWEGSLNILSQRASREMMRKTLDESMAMQVMSYLGLNKKLADEYKLKYERLYRSLLINSRRSLKSKVCVFLLNLVIVGLLYWLFIYLRGMILSLLGIKL